MIKKNDEEESNVDNFIENLDDSEEDEDESNTDSTLLATCGEFYFCVTNVYLLLRKLFWIFSFKGFCTKKMTEDKIKGHIIKRHKGSGREYIPPSKSGTAQKTDSNLAEPIAGPCKYF